MANSITKLSRPYFTEHLHLRKINEQMCRHCSHFLLGKPVIFLRKVTKIIGVYSNISLVMNIPVSNFVLPSTSPISYLCTERLHIEHSLSIPNDHVGIEEEENSTLTLSVVYLVRLIFNVHAYCSRE